MCSDYVESCNNMFDGNIIADYIETIRETDNLTACRAVVRQCFDKYGGTNFENFYYPYSGLFEQGMAIDWFTLYDYTNGPEREYKSVCAKQLLEIDSCSDPDIIETVFGGLDKFYVNKILTDETDETDEKYSFKQELVDYEDAQSKLYTISYGIKIDEPSNDNGSTKYVNKRALRSTGVATEVYNNIVSTLSSQCNNLQGIFVEVRNMNGPYQPENFCLAKTNYEGDDTNDCKDNILCHYKVSNNEDMCPRGYAASVDTQSWGACLCWENGGRRSKWGTTTSCVAALPLSEEYRENVEQCKSESEGGTWTDADWSSKNPNMWCNASRNTSKSENFINTNNQVCYTATDPSSPTCNATNEVNDMLPPALNKL